MSALPTEPGWYETAAGVDAIYLAADGAWMTASQFGAPLSEVEQLGPLTRLAPVADTARKVLDRVRGEAFAPPRAFGPMLLDKIGREFGLPPTVIGEHVVDGVTFVIGGAQNVNWRSDCAQCVHQGKGAFAPAHDASRGCKSGGHPHCTCDGCF